MMSPPDPDDDRSENKRTARLSRLLQWFQAFDLRDRWWRLLDYLEAHRGARRGLYCFLAGCILVVISWLWVYPWWMGRNTISMARQWIAAGQPNYAAEAVQKALEKNPHQPELWLLAAELARLNGQQSMEVDYARQAAQAQPANSSYALEWAGAALRADLRDETMQALAGVSGPELDRSPVAQRLLGELARRKQQLDDAVNHFEAALRIDGPGAIDEIPLGLCLIARRDAVQRQRGLDFLGKWTADREWGASALRILLEDAVLHNDLPAMAQWARALQAHPRCTVGDMPNCLLALAKSDQPRFADAIAQLKQAHRASPEAAAQLIGWLNQIGRNDAALEWMKTLPEQAMQHPPLAVSKAESLRLTGDWPALLVWVSQDSWGEKLDFLRWAYGLHAARSLGDEGKAGEFWHKLQDQVQTDGPHALFAGSTIYTWGLVNEAEALWWLAAAQNNNLAIEALGTLARHYQVKRDAGGQYRVFNQLHALHPQDADVTNNFAFFAALTGNREQLAEQLSRENLTRHPANPTYVATHAFVLLMRGHADESLKLIKPLAARVGASSAVAFVYGLALAETGDKTQAREVLKTIDPGALTVRETEVIRAALGS